MKDITVKELRTVLISLYPHSKVEFNVTCPSCNCKSKHTAIRFGTAIEKTAKNQLEAKAIITL